MQCSKEDFSLIQLYNANMEKTNDKNYSNLFDFVLVDFRKKNLL